MFNFYTLWFGNVISAYSLLNHPCLLMKLKLLHMFLKFHSSVVKLNISYSVSLLSEF